MLAKFIDNYLKSLYKLKSMREDVNPYVKKLGEFENYIIPCYLNKPSEEEKKKVLEKTDGYPDVILEICSGSGKHLLELARRNPNSLIVGFELRFKRIYMTAKKASRENLKNILLIRADAKNLNFWFKNQQISKLYINFPDPWDKDRWEKHRVLSEEFFNNLAQLLKRKGEFLYKTDHKERFNDVISLLKSNNLYKIVDYSYDLHDSKYKEANIMTEFESLFLSQGLKINYLKAVVS